MTPERWAKIEEIYHDALDRDTGARVAFLHQACLGDEELRREVESLLAQASGDLLNEPALNIASSNGKPPSFHSLIGEQLGAYKIIAKLGQGGMGVVYRARDTKLGRDVAIKVLPPEVVNDAERLARFRREAKMLASLNHPNIATIYGLEDSGQIHFLVMEFVEGKNLAERLRRGPLPIKETLRIGMQVAEALEHAHQRKIIHRDLKPANVVATTEGRSKVLDFGLAKAFTDEAADASDPLTASMLPTEVGRIMGTPAYMSPEQAQGKPVDQQTDIWAFGCVLYELLTGKRAFSGENVTQTIAAVLHHEPDWNALPADTPSTVRTLLHRCLQKEPARRLHSAADLAIGLEDSIAMPGGALDQKTRDAERDRSSRSWKIWSAVIAGSVLVVAAALLWHFTSASVPHAVVRYVIPITEQEQPQEGDSSLLMAPDGNHLAILTTNNGIPSIYLRSMQNPGAQALAGTDGVSYPFFSPDSQWIGFFADGKLKKISISGGAPVVLCDAPSPRGGYWGDNGTIVFTPVARGRGIFEMNADGGSPKEITTLDAAHGETSHRMPILLPGGRWLLYVTYGATYSDVNIIAQSVETGERKKLIEGASQPWYVSTGHLLYVQPKLAGKLIAVPFDSAQVKLTGPPTPIVDDVLTRRGDSAYWTVSGQGTLVYAAGGLRGVSGKLTWVDRKGISQPLNTPLGTYGAPRISPDGQHIAFELGGATEDIWIYDLTTNASSRFTFAGNNAWPVWVDVKELIYASNRAEPWELYLKPIDGSAPEKLLSADPRTRGGVVTSVSPDGKLIALNTYSPNSLPDIWVMPVSEPERAKPWLQTPAAEIQGQFSPDGQWMAYESNESGRNEIYVRPFPGPGEEREISLEGGTEPAWSRNGKELFFRNGEKLMATDIQTTNGFRAGTPHELFSGPFQQGGDVRAYDVTPDGQRFLMIQPSADEQSPKQLNVVVNWFEELKQNVRASK